MFDEMLEEVKVDWSESVSGRATAGAGGGPVSPQSGRGAGPILCLVTAGTNQLLRPSSLLPLQCCLLTISRSFLNSPTWTQILALTIVSIRFLESILKD